MSPTTKTTASARQRSSIGRAASSDSSPSATTRLIAVRLLVLQAMPDAQAFYARRGFHFTIEKDKERGKRNRTMFLDLDQVADVA